jgi:hypothetical protein
VRAAVAVLAVGGVAALAPVGVTLLGVAAATGTTIPASLPSSGSGSATAAPYVGGATGCAFTDPTGTGGCVTGSTAHAVAQVWLSFGKWPASCWDEHAWNPGSDHPRGLGCDFTVGRIGRFPGPEDRARGWELAQWLLDNADPLAVRYVIWDGTYCRANGPCRPYSGGGVYDPSDATGGHFDHVHVSLRDGSGRPA